MKCDEAMERLTARLAGAGAEADARKGTIDREVDLHVKSCERCRREAAETRALWNDLGALEDLEGGVPSTELRRRFDTMLAGYKASRVEGAEPVEVDRADTASAPGRVLPWRERFSGSDLARLVAAATVLLAVLVGGLAGGWWIGRSGGGGEELEALRTEVRGLHEMVALSLLERPAATDRLRGVSFGARSAADAGAQRSDRRVVAALVETVARDPNVHVRLAAIDALAPAASDVAVREALLRALPEQEAPVVQIALADLLLDSDGAHARRAVGDLLNDPELHPEVRRHLARRLGKSI